ncbi:hypothetical protein [uncultured Jatrophihabitans sp.]|uniref:hypothetical protein n=1 Tax=uncultured Jatrophihabitans sp. TaxID=1610747 RepID=UPI0035CBF17C
MPSARVASDERDFIASVVLVNGLGHTFPVPGKCSGWLAAGLASAAIPFDPAYSTVGCANDTIHPGITRLSRTVETTYRSCSQDPHAGVTAGFPACIGINHDQMPRLPLGRYGLHLDTSNIRHAVISAPVAITLIKP